MKKYVIFLALINFVSCLPQSPKIVIYNKTNITYDSIKVYTSPEISTVFFDVTPKAVMKGKIKFDSNNNSDGAYIIEMYNSEKTSKLQNFGYYTNGAPLHRKIEIEIYPDRIGIRYF